MEKGRVMRNLSVATGTKSLLTLVTSIALIGTGIAGCSKTEDVPKLMSEARQYQQKGDDKAAIIQLKNVLQKNPDDAEARHLLGTIYNKTGELQSAEKELRRALNLGLSPEKVLPDLGRTLLNLGQFQKVLDETQQLSENKNSPEISTLRGRALLALGKAKEAKDLFEQALHDKPGFPDALIGLARYSLAEKDIETAMRFTEQAVAGNPDNADAWLFKGDLLRTQGKTDLALAAYDQAAKLKPNNSTAFINKAFIEIDTGKLEAAKADIDAARKVAPGNLMVLYTQALLDFTQGKNAVAWESLQQILSKAPEHMPSVLLAGAVQLALGSIQQAEQHLKHYLDKDPGNLYARKLMASIMLKSRQPQRAIAILSPMLKNVQQDPQLFALAGESYMQAKDFAKATEYFEKASNIAPESVMLHTALSMSKLGEGDGSRAVAELEKATKLDPKSANAGILLVMTHLRLKEFDKALTAAKTLEKEHPDNPFIQNLKGGIYLGKKDVPSARASFEKALSLDPVFFPAVTNLAQLDLRDKNPDAAKKRFEAILQKDPKNIQAMTALSGLALNQGQAKEATAWLERAAKENPDALQPAMLLGVHYLRLGEKQKALIFAQKLQGTHTRDPGVLELLAQAQFANDDKAGALESYNKLAVVMPESALAQFRIASIHMSMQNLPAASDALKKALTLKPDYLDAQLAQVILEAQKGNYERAISISRQIQKQQQKSPVGYIAEGDLQMKQKNSVLAIKAYEHALTLNKSQPLIIKLHELISQTGKGKEANTRLLQWLKERPDDASVRMYLAGVYLTDGQTKSAIEQYRIVLQKNPDYVPALNNLATAYQREKDPLALEYAEKAYKLTPESPEILDTLGWILVEQGNLTRGLPLLQKAASLAPDIGEIRYHFALGLVKAGDKAKARKELEQLLATGKDFPQINEAKTLLKQI